MAAASAFRQCAGSKKPPSSHGRIIESMDWNFNNVSKRIPALEPAAALPAFGDAADYIRIRKTRWSDAAASARPARGQPHPFLPSPSGSRMRRPLPAQVALVDLDALPHVGKRHVQGARGAHPARPLGIGAAGLDADEVATVALLAGIDQDGGDAGGVVPLPEPEGIQRAELALDPRRVVAAGCAPARDGNRTFGRPAGALEFQLSGN